MKLKQLESALCSVPKIEFETPDVTLEQYPTTPHLTAQIMQVATQQYNDIGPNRTVIDLGCGTAMLSIGCALVDTDHIIAIDCDTNALQQAQENVNDMELNDRISFLQAKVPFRNRNIRNSGDRDQPHLPRNKNHRHRNSANIGGGRSRSHHQHQLQKFTNNTAAATTNRNDVDDLYPTERSGTAMTGADEIPLTTTRNDHNSCQFPLHTKCVDTVLTNPPFGTKGDNAGIDIEFVLLACQLAQRAVYSFHKTTTRNYVLRTIQANVSNLLSVHVVAEMKFNISNTYQFHQQKSVNIAVDLIRVEMIHS